MKTKQPEREKVVTLNDKLIAVIAYKNPTNDLIANLDTLGAIWDVLRAKKKEVIKLLFLSSSLQRIEFVSLSKNLSAI